MTRRYNYIRYNSGMVYGQPQFCRYEVKLKSWIRWFVVTFSEHMSHKIYLVILFLGLFPVAIAFATVIMRINFQIDFSVCEKQLVILLKISTMYQSFFQIYMN